jgi:Second Messenger Oligonucleotide or Dinucleotide Synthetase domain
MATHALTDNFARFFTRLNPSTTFEQDAASEYARVKQLIESKNGPAGAIAPHCFLQGSYRQETAIYAINDVDIVALCRLWYPPTPGFGSAPWPRDQIFATVAEAIAADATYAPKVSYGTTSMVIKVDLAIKVEVLPVVYEAGHNDPQYEPFILFRPETHRWERGWARAHQYLLTQKNAALGVAGNFKPMIKVLKHLRTQWNLDAVSFHLECLLYSLPNLVFVGGAADYITNVLLAIAQKPADAWYEEGVLTPCADRNIFTSSEWPYTSWRTFHDGVGNWLYAAGYAAHAQSRGDAITGWQTLLGDDHFPAAVT